MSSEFGGFEAFKIRPIKIYKAPQPEGLGKEFSKNYTVILMFYILTLNYTIVFENKLYYL